MFVEERLQALEQLFTVMQSEIIQARTAAVQVEQRETCGNTGSWRERLRSRGCSIAGETTELRQTSGDSSSSRLTQASDDRM